MMCMWERCLCEFDLRLSSFCVCLWSFCYLTMWFPFCRVPGNFHIEMRSKHHNINPTAANLSHVVNHLSFGPVLTSSASRKLSQLPDEFFQMKNLNPLDEHMYRNDKLHQAFHHYLKVVSTTLDLGGRHSANNSILAYQMVGSSQMMMVRDVIIVSNDNNNNRYHVVNVCLVRGRRCSRSAFCVRHLPHVRAYLQAWQAIL